MSKNHFLCSSFVSIYLVVQCVRIQVSRRKVVLYHYQFHQMGSSKSGNRSGNDAEMKLVRMNLQSCNIAKPPLRVASIKYEECLRNYATSIGGHVKDGCLEFMPIGEEGNGDALICAVCGCHRNFHKKEMPVPSLLHPPPPVLLYSGYRWKNKKKEQMPETSERGELQTNVAATEKRFWTKFTYVPKGKMLEFANKVGWKIQRHDDVAWSHV